MKTFYEHRGMVVPDETIETINNYIAHGVPTGDFMHAVLTNDLRQAASYADDGNARALCAIVAYLYNEAPSIAWGSAEKVNAWLKSKRVERDRERAL